jgi:hypothetical protein
MDDDSTDRMLVRPYVQSGAEKPGAEPKVSSIHTEEIPQPAPAPARGEEENTAVLPVIKASPAAESDGGRRLVLWLVGAGLALILVAAVAVVALWPGGDEDRSAALPGTSVLPGGGAAPVTAAAPSVRASAKASASASASASPSARTSSAARASASPPRSAAPSETLAPPPAVDRIGAITGPGGHCLDLRGGVALPGGAVSAYACNGTPSQRWTLGADGTLRVGGMCATPDGSAVHLGGCDASAQWRAGSGGTLVNAGAARCLTDPDNGTTTGARMTLATCGGTGQRWTLP